MAEEQKRSDSVLENGSFGTRAKICWSSCSEFIYNPKTQEILGRTGKSWIHIIMFYMCFYTFLITVFVGLIYIYLMLTLNRNPYHTGDRSLLKLTPGLQVYPVLDVNSLLFSFNSNNNTPMFIQNAREIHKFLRVINSTNTGNSPQAKCIPSSAIKSPNDSSHLCTFNINELGICANPVKVWKRKGICVYLAIDNVYGWLPEIEDHKINGASVKCKGVHYGDEDNILSISYYPNYRGVGYFSHVYFPYTNQDGYKKPYVALHMNVMEAAVIFMECKIENVRRHVYSKFGEIKSHFEVILNGPSSL